VANRGLSGRWRSRSSSEDREGPRLPRPRRLGARRPMERAEKGQQFAHAIRGIERFVSKVYAGPRSRRRKPTHLTGVPGAILRKERGTCCSPRALSSIPHVVALTRARPRLGRRRALAEWIARGEDNPMARPRDGETRRLGTIHFGRGSWTTLADFGFHGDRPVAPEAADWMAASSSPTAGPPSRPAPSGGIVLSGGTYRQSSTVRSPRPYGSDAQKIALAVGACSPTGSRPEAISRRDVLAVSGRLALRMGGPALYTLWEPNHEYVGPFQGRLRKSRSRGIRRLVSSTKSTTSQAKPTYPTFGAFRLSREPAPLVAPRREHLDTRPWQALTYSTGPIHARARFGGRSRGIPKARAAIRSEAQSSGRFKLAIIREHYHGSKKPPSGGGGACCAPTAPSALCGRC